MGNINGVIVTGLLLLVPVLILVLVVYGAIKCSEWHIWTAHNLIGARRKIKSRSSTSKEAYDHQASSDLERGIPR